MPSDDLTPGGILACAVVVTHNRKALLKECLGALLAQTRPADEIIVIDNDSTDGTEEAVKSEFAGVTYLRMADNIGGAGGFHEGVRVAFEKGYDWIWVMDDDALPMADALQRLLDCRAIIDPKTCAVASAVVASDGSLCLLHRRLFDPNRMLERPVDAGRYREASFETDSCSFVGMLISRRAVQDVGLPLKEFFIYCDDTEYSLRLRKRGMIFTIPDSKVVHGEPESKLVEPSARCRPYDWKRYYGMRNRTYTYRKHGKGGLAFCFSIFKHTIADVGGTILFRQSKFDCLTIIFCGVADGLRGKLGKNTRFLPPKAKPGQ